MNEFIEFINKMNQMELAGEHLDLTKIPSEYLVSKEKMGEFTKHIYSQLNKKESHKCLFPGCNNDAISSHSIQKALLKTIADKTNHLYRFGVNAEFTFDGKIEAIVEKIGINKASVFFGYCSDHDTNLFLPIESKPLEEYNIEQNFLLLLRSLNKEYFGSRKAYFLFRDAIVPVLQNLGEYDMRGPYLISKLYLKYCELHWIENLKQSIDAAFLLQEYSFPFTFKTKFVDMPCPIFVSTFFALQGTINNILHDIDITKDLPYYFSFSILPINNNKTGIFYAYLSEQEDRIKDFLLCFEEKDIDKLQIFLTDTILRNSENFYISSEHFEKLNKLKLDLMKDFFYHTITNRNYQNRDFMNMFV
jgi:hypothetical protein